MLGHRIEYPTPELDFISYLKEHLQSSRLISELATSAWYKTIYIRL